jgi:hypothetical protein
MPKHHFHTPGQSIEGCLANAKQRVQIKNAWLALINDFWDRTVFVFSSKAAITVYNYGKRPVLLNFQVNRDEPKGRDKTRHLLFDCSQDLLVSLVLQYREEEGVHHEI